MSRGTCCACAPSPSRPRRQRRPASLRTSLPSLSASPAPPASDAVVARAAAAKRDWKKVRSLLDKKARAGAASPEEVSLLREACEKLKDKACVDMLAKAYSEPPVE